MWGKGEKHLFKLVEDGKMFENSGHFLRIEEPEKYFNVVSGFVDGIKKICRNQ